MVIDTTSIDRTVSMTFNDPGITTGNAAIGAAINKRSFTATRSLGHTVLDIVRPDLSHLLLVSVDGECIVLDLNLGFLDRLREDCKNISWMTIGLLSVGMFGDHSNQKIIDFIH